MQKNKFWFSFVLCFAFMCVSDVYAAFTKQNCDSLGSYAVDGIGFYVGYKNSAVGDYTLCRFWGYRSSSGSSRSYDYRATLYWAHLSQGYSFDANQRRMYGNLINALRELDTDGDGQSDYFELWKGTDSADDNSFAVSDGGNKLTDINWLTFDTDEDGISDKAEFAAGTDWMLDSDMPTLDQQLLLDTDGDGVDDAQEWLLGYDPYDDTSTPTADELGDVDSDSDGYNDAVEIAAGTNPNDINSKPSGGGGSNSGGGSGGDPADRIGEGDNPYEYDDGGEEDDPFDRDEMSSFDNPDTWLDEGIISTSYNNFYNTLEAKFQLSKFNPIWSANSTELQSFDLVLPKILDVTLDPVTIDLTGFADKWWVKAFRALLLITLIITALKGVMQVVRQW